MKGRAGMSISIHEDQGLTSTPAAEFDVARERLSRVYANLPTTLAGSLAAACILVLLLQTVIHTVELVAWLGVGCLITCTRFLNYRRFCRVPKSLDVQSWRTRFEVGTMASGMFWGYAGAGLFPADDFTRQVFIAYVLAGLCASAMSSYAGLLRAYYLFVLPAILPFVLRTSMEGSNIHYSMAALTVLFLANGIRSAIETDRMFSNVLSVRAHNAELTAALHHRATHDALVDLINHREFNDRLAAAAKDAAKTHQPYAVLFVDLDHFKAINDTAGHAAGDETLRRIAHILKGEIRASDIAARMGGDEFAILLPGCPRERAERVAANVLAAVVQFAQEWEGGKFGGLSASIGVAYTNAGEHDAEVVLRAADSACLAAKTNGRGRIEVYHADPIYESSGRFRL
jgi:diguanylate cyclase (GGDEF)-like protein